MKIKFILYLHEYLFYRGVALPIAIGRLAYLGQFYRGVAQLASVLAWGARGRKFKSSRPDKSKPFHKVRRLFLFYEKSLLDRE
jgi:hypothetical protein